MSSEHPDQPEDPIPENSFLSLDDYLEMYHAISTPTGFRLTYKLDNLDRLTLSELEAGIDGDVRDALVDLVIAGVVQRRVAVDAGVTRALPDYQIRLKDPRNVPDTIIPERARSPRAVP